jgi:hypothetical protein
MVKSSEAYIIDIPIKNHPAAILGVVLRDFRRVDGLRHLELLPLLRDSLEPLKKAF